MADDGKQNATLPTPQVAEDWREVAERASNETDPKKLLELIEHLCELLEANEAERKRPSPGFRAP